MDIIIYFYSFARGYDDWSVKELFTHKACIKISVSAKALRVPQIDESFIPILAPNITGSYKDR